MPTSQTVPSHLGLILDGNRRWAKQHGLATLEGHRRGYDNLKDIVKAAVNSGVKYVSAFIFSTENWDRTPTEVKYLMDLAHTMLTRDVAELNRENIRVLWLGSPDKVSGKLLKTIRKAEEDTKHNTKGTLCICFNYGGEQELVDATRQLITRGKTPSEITVETLAGSLYQPEVPQLDLLIRTSGEHRLSGFMLYRAAYAELIFVEKHWPDFTVNDLSDALKEYATRQRRFGT